MFGALDATKPEHYPPAKKPNMLILLLPWIAIWIAMAIDSTVGSVAGIAAASFVPLLWLRFRPVIFEQVSVPIVTGISFAALFGADIRLVVSGSYLIFGLIWIVGSFTEIPLTAYYSASGYGGNSAFSNPLFIRTNRILSFVWGSLYLITPIWTYILMGTGYASYTGLINSLLPAFMGIFTVWFIKWYPARYARG